MNLACRLTLHHYRTVKDTGIHHYDICKRCGKRRIERVRFGGHQPIDRHWLETGEWMVLRPPRGIRSAVVPPPERTHDG